MSSAEIIAWISLGATVIGVIFVVVRDLLKARNEARTVDLAARSTGVEVDDKIAARRLTEIERLDGQIKDLKEEFRQFKEQAALDQAQAARERIATANVLRDAAEQWPPTAPGPVFNEADIAVLEDTFPVKWRRRPGAPSMPILPT